MNKKNKLVDMIFIIIGILFLVFPTSYGLSNFKIVIFSFLLLCFLCFLLKKTSFRIPTKYYLIIIISLAVISRFGIVLIFNSSIQQLSDFKMLLEQSRTLNFDGIYYLVFTHWILYAKLINFVYYFFGETQLVALLSNSVILVINSILVYKTASLIMDNNKYGFYASLIYILWPANILYTLIFTQEHFGQLLLLLSLLLFIVFNKKSSTKIYQYGYPIGIGIFLGLSTFFKNFAPVFVIAFAMYYILDLLRCNNINIKTIIKKSAVFLIILASFILSKSLIYSYLDNLVGQKVARNITYCYLNVGLRENGKNNPENYDMYLNAIKKHKYDYDAANKEIKKKLIRYIKDKNSEVRHSNFFEEKSKILFSNDRSRIIWVQVGFVTAKHKGIAKKMEIVKIINDIYFIGIVTLMAIGVFFSIKKRNLELILLYLILHGSFLMLLLVETQNRYMYSIQTLMCILAVPGLIQIYSKVSKKQL